MTDTSTDPKHDLTLQLDWSAYRDAGMGDAYADIPKHGGHYAKAIAACINSRQCEADGKQVMCPSYRVSGEPNLSTGGRVRLLKAALGASQESAPLLTPELEAAMDLCVSCKGCKRECESNVDMPLIKAEYLAQKYALQPRSWRSRLFAHLPMLIQNHPWLGTLISWRNSSACVRWVVDPILKLNSTVNLPQPRPLAIQQTSQQPSQQLRTETTDEADATQAASEKPRVVLFLDTFTRQFDPHIATAAIKVLTHAGYEVQLLEPDNPAEPGYCCGRTWLAQGMIPEAKQQAQRLIQAILPFVNEGYTIVGLEASCVLGLRDDAQALGLEEDVAKAAKNTFLLEEFLARETKAKRLNLALNTPDTATLIHGHCHQKATGAMKSVRRVMKLIPDHTFEFIDASCCGMAGSFGLEAEHATHSRTMAEQGLLPALKNTTDQCVIANGFSCRQQIRNHSDAQPMHLAELLANHLD